MTIPAHIFRAYDVRGIAGSELSTELTQHIGCALGTLILESGEDTLLYGADARLSSPELSAALQTGLLSTGCNLIDLGIIPTPLLYFATHATQWTCGVMLTASHNPASYNGVKIVKQRTCLTAEQIQDLRQRISAGDFARGQGKRITLSIKADYLQRITQDIHLQRPLRVVVDCGNAVPGLIAPDLLEALGCDVQRLFCDVDGCFPNHHPDPTVSENLQALIAQVLQTRADLGIAFDGDGDRVVMVTNAGSIIDTDRLLMLLVRDILPRYRDPAVLFDVKCSKLLVDVIAAAGGRSVMGRSGHSYMKQMMKETEAVVGAEFSAHVFIKDRWYGHDDGMYVAARFLEILAAGSHSAEELLQSLPASVVTPELRIEVSDTDKFTLMERIKDAAEFHGASINMQDGLRVDYPDSWGLIRASNTTPALLLRFEAQNQESLLLIQSRFRDLLREIDAKLKIGF